MKTLATYIFLAVQGILYIGYLTGDIFEVGKPKILKFIAILMLAIFGLLAGKQKENKAATAVFFFTLLADIFFVLMDKAMYGIATYIIIQLIHTVRLSFMSEKNLTKELLKRVIPAFCLGALGAFVGPRLPLIIAYAVCIAVNLVHVIELKIKNPCDRNIRYMIGMIILVIGDLGVGLRNIQADFVTDDIMKIAYIITWLTYVPSLILILSTTDALSFKKQK